jgi:peroxiredoxin
MMPLGSPAPGFSLPDFDGRLVKLADFAGKPLLIVFMCNHCPFVKHLADHFAAFTAEFMPQGLAVVAIQSNDVATHPDDSPPKMKAEALARGYRFHYLYDESQAVARAYRAACTPDFFLFDRSHKLAYRGQYDSTRPRQTPPQTPTGADLRAAVEAVLSGGVVESRQYPSTGCNIKWKPGAEPDYFKFG